MIPRLDPWYGLPVVGPLLRGMSVIPLFLPGVVLSVGIGGLLAPVAARWLRTRTAVALLLLVTTGVIVALTLTPDAMALEAGIPGTGTCSLRRVGLASVALLTHVNDVSLNVLLFVPLGVGLALLPLTSRSAVAVAAAVAAPFAIELTQMLMPSLGRSCESADVIDNLTGLAIGLAITALVVRGGGLVTRRIDGRRPNRA